MSNGRSSYLIKNTTIEELRASMRHKLTVGLTVKLVKLTTNIYHCSAS
jgi:hypothetical protein